MIPHNLSTTSAASQKLPPFYAISARLPHQSQTPKMEQFTSSSPSPLPPHIHYQPCKLSSPP
jgi:hypothetical protein